MPDLRVTTQTLEDAVTKIRRRKSGPMRVPTLDVSVSAAQLTTAARLIREPGPSVITKINGRRVGNPVEHELSAWLMRVENQPELVAIQVGLFGRPQTIDRRGQVPDPYLAENRGTDRA